jgi:hypothetical protein
MLIFMRTTLIIDDELFRQAKRRAVERNETLSEVMNRALRESLGQPKREAPPFALITYGRGSPRVHHEPGDFDAALEGEEKDRLRQC